MELIDNLPNKESTGWDGISSSLIKRLKDVLGGPLHFLINQCISHSCFPSPLKIAKVIPLFKKGNKHSIENYRPISLLTSFSKIFERAIFKQLSLILSHNNILHPSQYGYRKNHSTELAAAELVDRVSKALEERPRSHHSLGIFMDLSNAYRPGTDIIKFIFNYCRIFRAFHVVRRGGRR